MHAHAWDVEFQGLISHSSDRREFFIAPGITYNALYTGLSTAIQPEFTQVSQVSQVSNLFTLDVGEALMKSRALPHADLILSVHFETPIGNPFANFTLTSGKVREFAQGRSLTLAPRAGVRYQNRVSYIEIGAQAGEEFRALEGYSFQTRGGDLVQCTLDMLPASTTLAQCIQANKSVKENSPVAVLRTDRTHVGAYWKASLALPFSSKLSYVFSDQGNFFFNNLIGRDTVVDTRFIDTSKHQLRFSVWPTLSFGPAFQLLLYQNMVNRDFLVQKQFLIEADFTFDLFNIRRKKEQIKYKPAPK